MWRCRCGGALGRGTRIWTGLRLASVTLSTRGAAAGVDPNGVVDEAAEAVGATMSPPCNIQGGARCSVNTACDGTRARGTLGLSSGIRLSVRGKGKSLHSSWLLAAVDCQPLPARFPRLTPFVAFSFVIAWSLGCVRALLAGTWGVYLAFCDRMPGGAASVASMDTVGIGACERTA